VLNAIKIDMQALFRTTRTGIEKANTLDIATIT
jgi:hypothetical protein